MTRPAQNTLAALTRSRDNWEHPPYLGCFEGLGPDLPRGDGRVGDDNPRIVVQIAEDHSVQAKTPTKVSTSNARLFPQCGLCLPT